MVEAKLLRKKLKNGLIVDKWDLVTIIENQQAEIEDLKNANRFIQNFAEEQHQRAVALEMRELTDEEIWELSDMVLNNSDVIGFARAILRKAQEQ